MVRAHLALSGTTQPMNVFWRGHTKKIIVPNIFVTAKGDDRTSLWDVLWKWLDCVSVRKIRANIKTLATGCWAIVVAVGNENTSSVAKHIHSDIGRPKVQ